MAERPTTGLRADFTPAVFLTQAELLSPINRINEIRTDQFPVEITISSSTRSLLGYQLAVASVLGR